jgi:membrane associated rhomboid family serine protease
MIPVRDTIPSRRTPIATWSIIAINIAVFLYELSLSPQDLERLTYLFGLVPARYAHPQWAQQVGLPIDEYWPLFTCMFLHGGWAHLIGNMWTLWIFGDNVEDRMGPFRFVIFYLLTGLAAGAVHWFTNMDSTVPTVGASGAIAGVLGAYFTLFPRSRIIAVFPVLFFPFFFELPAVVYLLFWLLSQLVGATMQSLGPGSVGGIAFWAHVGGFASGILLHRLFLLPQRLTSRRIQPDELGIEGVWAARNGTGN